MADFIQDNDESNETFMLHEIARQLRVSFDRRTQHLGLTRSQWHALAILRRNGGMRQAQLAERMEVEPITLVRILDRMEKAGWIERRPDPNDRRANQLHLTPKVSGIIQEMRRIALSVRRDALKGFSKDEHTHLISYLSRMKTNAAAMMKHEDE